MIKFFTLLYGNSDSVQNLNLVLLLTVEKMIMDYLNSDTIPKEFYRSLKSLNTIFFSSKILFLSSSFYFLLEIFLKLSLNLTQHVIQSGKNFTF